MNIRDIINQELISDEYFLWIGQPNDNVYFTQYDVFLIPFSLIFSIFGIPMGLASFFAFDDPFLVFVGSFMLMSCLYFLFGRFIYKKYKKINTIYAVTNLRVMSVTKLLSRRRTMSKYIKDIKEVNKMISRYGNGSIFFENKSFLYKGMVLENTGLEVLSAIRTGSLSFYDIDNAESVYNLFYNLWENYRNTKWK